jgi:hypothetical protein
LGFYGPDFSDEDDDNDENENGDDDDDDDIRKPVPVSNHCTPVNVDFEILVSPGRNGRYFKSLPLSPSTPTPVALTRKCLPLSLFAFTWWHMFRTV